MASAKKKSIRFATVAICDFATKSERNKHTLVNVYSGDIVVAEMPADLHFGFYAEAFLPDEPLDRIELELRLGDKEIARAQFRLSERADNKMAVLLIPAFRLTAEAEGDFEIIATAEGYVRSSILTKSIVHKRLD